MLPCKPWPALNSQACDHRRHGPIASATPKNRKDKVERRQLVGKAPFPQRSPLCCVLH